MTKEKILIVEDEVDLAQMMVALMQDCGYQTCVAFNGLQGQEMALRERPDLILLDLRLPQMSGMKLLYNLREHEVSAPVVVVSAWGSEELAIQALRLGVKDYIKKPFRMNELVEVVERALTEERLRRERDTLTGQLQASNERLERQVRQLTALYEVGQALASTLEHDELIRVILQEACRVLDVDVASIFLLDEQTGELVFRSGTGECAQMLLDLRLEPGQGIAGWVAQNGRPLLVADVHLDPRFSSAFDQITNIVTQSVLCVPLMIKGHVIGVLEALNKPEPGFTGEDLAMLSSLGASAAVSIENARLYERVKSEQQQLNAILLSTADAVIVVNRDLRLTMANPAAERLLGFSLEDVRGRSLSWLLSHDQVKGDLEPLLHPQSLEPFAFDLQVGQRMMRGHAAPMKGQEDDLRGWVAALQDITDLKELDRLKSQMIRMASHDLRNPLHLAINFHLMLDRHISDPDPQLVEILDGLERSLVRMEDLIGDLLDLERIESGAGRRIEPLDWPALVQDVVSELRESAEQKRHTVAVDLPPDLPAVSGDRVQLRQALSNLVGNAIKYTPEGGRITVHSQPVQGELHVKVQDNGLGVPAEQLPNLFQHFYRAQQPGTEKIAGTGLGLSLVKAVVEGHGGRVWVESQENEGSTFGFALPLNHI